MRSLDLSQIGMVYIACGYSDLRRGINGLAAQVQQQFKLDPRQQEVFLFCGKGRFAAANFIAKRLILTTPEDLAKPPTKRPIQGTILGRRWIRSAVQVSGGWTLPVAAKPEGIAGRNAGGGS